MAAVAAVADITQGIFGFAQSSYQSQVAANNAKVAQWNATNALYRSQLEQQDQAAKSSGMMGELVADQSASGVALTSRSAGQTRSSLAKLGRLDVLRIADQGRTEAYNFMTEASNFQGQAAASELGAYGSLAGGFLSAGSSLASNSSPVSDKWNWMRQRGYFG